MSNMFEGTNLQPVRLKLGNNKFLTIWNHDEKDVRKDDEKEKIRVLGNGKKVFLFPNIDYLMKFLAREEECNMSQFAEYKKSAERAKNGISFPSGIVKSYNLDKVGELLEEFDPKWWDRRELHSVIGTVKFFLDCSITFGNRDLTKYIREGFVNRGKKVSLYSFFENFPPGGFGSEEVRMHLKRYNKKEGYNIYTMLMGNLMLNSAVYKKR